MKGNIAIYFPGKLRFPEERGNRLGRPEGARRAAICGHTLMLSSLEPLCLQTLGLGAPSSCSASGCSLPLSRLVLSPVSCPGLLPAGEQGGGMGCSAAWAALCPPGLPCNTASTGSAAASRQGEPHVMPWGHGALRPNLLGEAAGTGLCRLPLADSEVAVADSAAVPPALNRSVVTGGCWRGWCDL